MMHEVHFYTVPIKVKGLEQNSCHRQNSWSGLQQLLVLMLNCHRKKDGQADLKESFCKGNFSQGRPTHLCSRMSLKLMLLEGIKPNTCEQINHV